MGGTHSTARVQTNLQDGNRGHRKSCLRAVFLLSIICFVVGGLSYSSYTKCNKNNNNNSNPPDDSCSNLNYQAAITLFVVGALIQVGFWFAYPRGGRPSSSPQQPQPPPPPTPPPPPQTSVARRCATTPATEAGTQIPDTISLPPYSVSLPPGHEQVREFEGSGPVEERDRECE